MEKLVPYRPLTIWLTGLPSSGKSTIASLLKKRFSSEQIPATVLDGDELRKGLNKDLDLTTEGRKENIRRSVEVCKLMMDAGVVVISALISPFEEDREWARDYLGEEHFFLVYLNCPLEVCEARDLKGLYHKARKGIICNLTGIDGPYEIPNRPNLILETNLVSPEICAERTHKLAKGFQSSKIIDYRLPIKL